MPYPLRPRFSRPAAALLLLLAAATACTEPEQPSDLLVVYYGQAPYTNLQLVRAEVIQAGSERVILRGADLEVRATGADAIEAVLGRVRLRVGRPLSVRVVFSTGAGGNFIDTELPFVGDVQKKTDYSVGVTAGRTRPQGFCTSVARAIPFPSATEGATVPDTLFITQLGLPQRAVC